MAGSSARTATMVDCDQMTSHQLVGLVKVEKACFYNYRHVGQARHPTVSKTTVIDVAIIIRKNHHTRGSDCRSQHTM